MGGFGEGLARLLPAVTTEQDEEVGATAAEHSGQQQYSAALELSGRPHSRCSMTFITLTGTRRKREKRGRGRESDGRCVRAAEARAWGEGRAADEAGRGQRKVQGIPPQTHAFCKRCFFFSRALRFFLSGGSRTDALQRGGIQQPQRHHRSPSDHGPDYASGRS
jgi:hypothetical protein